LDNSEYTLDDGMVWGFAVCIFVRLPIKYIIFELLGFLVVYSSFPDLATSGFIFSDLSNIVGSGYEGSNGVSS
jgi:hypothetical protein